MKELTTRGLTKDTWGFGVNMNELSDWVGRMQMRIIIQEKNLESWMLLDRVYDCAVCTRMSLNT